ncbi:MAG: tannase/feruloyl esterase family alpha/beta hydrolase [Oscillospiraceae bacterium]|nr:tannase/feruloyl esterase family alpha/beta hydrolase [Oscillospiraceae bacterium]
MAGEESVRGLRLDCGEVTSVGRVGAGDYAYSADASYKGLPSFTRVSVTMRPSADSNVRVEVWLPEEGWNGRFLGTGNGGGGGNLYMNSCAEGLRRGYASANTDLGTSPGADEAIGHPERYADFGHRATHWMTVAGKAVTEAFYGRKAEASYFYGSSTGGSQALMEAQRYPDDYDGIVSIVPANNRTLLHAYFLWVERALTGRDGRPLLAEGDAEALHAAIVGARDRRGDGGAPGDRFFTDPRRSYGRIADAVDGLPFRAEAKDALMKVYGGPVNPRTGERIFGPYTIGAENGLIATVAKGRPDWLYYIFRWAFGSGFDPMSFDFDVGLERLNRALARHVNANDPDLGAFRDSGGKLIIVTGTQDDICPHHDTINYYERVCGRLGGLGAVSGFARLFAVPGCWHGPAGVPGFRSLGMDGGTPLFETVAAWFERGEAPDRLLMGGHRDEAQEGGAPMQRHVYPYPRFAVYKGGDGGGGARPPEGDPEAYEAEERPMGVLYAASERLLSL